MFHCWLHRKIIYFNTCCSCLFAIQSTRSASVTTSSCSLATCELKLVTVPSRRWWNLSTVKFLYSYNISSSRSCVSCCCTNNSWFLVVGMVKLWYWVSVFVSFVARIKSIEVIVLKSSSAGMVTSRLARLDCFIFYALPFGSNVLLIVLWPNAHLHTARLTFHHSDRSSIAYKLRKVSHTHKKISALFIFPCKGFQSLCKSLARGAPVNCCLCVLGALLKLTNYDKQTNIKCSFRDEVFHVSWVFVSGVSYFVKRW